MIEFEHKWWLDSDTFCIHATINGNYVLVEYWLDKGSFHYLDENSEPIEFENEMLYELNKKVVEYMQ